MTPLQRGYLRGALYPSIAEGIDLILIHCGRKPWGWNQETVHQRLKESFGVESLEDLSHSDCCDYITQVQAWAAGALIFVPSPEEYRMGTEWKAREAHYNYVLADEPLALQEAA